MMKKVIKKLLAALLAVAMVCAMAIPAFAYNPGETKEDLNTKHDYGAFQIFKGVISKDNPTLSGVDWGQNITEPDIFLANLKNDPTIGEKFETAATAQEVLAVISQWSNSDDNSIAFARVVCHYLYPDANANPTPVATDHTGGINIPKSGYYLIVDTSTFSDDDFYHAYNSFFLLNVPQTPYVVLVNHKVVKPTVEKEVYDNNDIGSTGGWGSSADHAINEPFQFRLIAKLPASENNGRAYDYYKEYAVCFNDTLSDGITFDKLDKVEIANVDGGNPQVIDAANYTRNPNVSQSFKLSIDNVKTCAAAAGLNLNEGATITVTYTAHLNEKAYVNIAGGGTDNKNRVYLEYSNNPRISTSLDHTPESEVCVYTYQLNNTKYRDEDKPGNELEGAGFRLYSDEACNNEIKLKKNNDGTYSRDFSTGASGVEMISDNKGQFNVKGLDAGTYYLKETTPPKDYNACADKEIVISATHDVNHVSLSGNLSTTIINKKDGGITLPSTGGIGTTIFYVVGGGLMVAAIVLLVTKKRMENK
jgi:fimbrial isopeptide formation D2 family protein/LPXTG-motif cell wall-anchored protein